MNGQMNTWGRCDALPEGVVSAFGRRSFDERYRRDTFRVLADPSHQFPSRELGERALRTVQTQPIRGQMMQLLSDRGVRPEYLCGVSSL